MKITVLNGSPSGDNSITLYTVKYIQLYHPGIEFDVIHVGQQIRKMERDPGAWKEAVESADLILFSYPVYTFLVPAQLHRFIELMKSADIDLKGKFATQLTTSKHFYDVTAHRFIEDNCADLGLRYIRGLSADMDDLLNEDGRKQALDWFRRVLWSMEKGFSETPSVRAGEHTPVIATPVSQNSGKSGRKLVIVTDSSAPQYDSVSAMIARFCQRVPYDSEIVDLKEFPFAGGCLGCFHCASGGKCVYRDGFDEYLRQHIQSADAIVYAFAIADHSMGYRMKLYDDRQFCNGHRTVTMGKPVAYLVSGRLDLEENVRLVIESRAQVGGNHLSGVASDVSDPDGEIDKLAASLAYDLENAYEEPQNFYGVGGLKIFRDLIYQMRGLMRADHKFYKEHGFYDFPQKRKGRIVGMYAVGALMGNEKIRKKAGAKMTEGMCMPYQRILDRAAKNEKPEGAH